MNSGRDVLVVGGGIVGLAIARALLARSPRTRLLLVEKEPEVAAHQTGHNSGVVHTGVYYRPGSLKAQLCVTGAREMIAYCRERGLPLQIPGKIIVATQPAELSALREILRRGQANGVEQLRWLESSEVAEFEPHVPAFAALHVPTAAIVDYAAVARSYDADITTAGGEVCTGAEVTSFAVDGAEVVVETTQGEFRARCVVNCAGLQADRIAAMAGAHLARELQVLPFRGEYYQLTPTSSKMVRGLIYPVPDTRFPFLGVHLTPRVYGGVEAGPNAVLAWKREGYGRLDWNLRDAAAMLAFPGFWAMAGRYWRKGLAEQHRSLSRTAFLRALRGLLPGLSEDDLLPGGSGVRAQIVLRNGRLMDDFHVVRQGLFFHVINVPSPAATASLAIGRHLASLI